MPKVIDQPTFDKIECSRCGQCCENIVISTTGSYQSDIETKVTGFWRHVGPLGWLEWYAGCVAVKPDSMDAWVAPQDPMLWFGQLEPFLDDNGEWRYKCGHFQRESDGSGTCTIYNERPKHMCGNFPYGHEVGGYDQCVWDKDRIVLLDYEVVEHG